MIHSFLLIGQSNMAEHGYLNEATEIDTRRLWVLRNGRWQRLYRPVNGDRPFSGVCLAESFAEAYSRQYGVDVGLIPCADGGTSLDQWLPGSVLYDHAVAQARLAQRSSVIAGVLWHQGEADCGPALHTTYAERFQTMLDALRQDLHLSDVPVLLGGLGDFLPNCTADKQLVHYQKLNEALQQITKHNRQVGFVSAEGLTANPDSLHFNAASLYEFGLRYFAEFEKHRDPNKRFEEVRREDGAERRAMELL